MATRLDTLFQTICLLNKQERREILRRLAALPDFSEDLQDIAVYLERKDLPSRPYDAFRQELQAEGRL